MAESPDDLTARPTDYTDPTTIDVAEVQANINWSFTQRGHRWDDTLNWPNVTVKALADLIDALSGDVARLEAEAVDDDDLIATLVADIDRLRSEFGALVAERDATIERLRDALAVLCDSLVNRGFKPYDAYLDARAVLADTTPTPEVPDA